MSKDIKLVICMLLFFCPFLNVSALQQTVIMGGQYDDPNYEGPPFKRSPIVPIYVYQDEHNFVFETTLFGESVEVLRDGNLLFATKIDANGKIIIPTDISGEVELRLIRGSITYHATVVL